MSEIKRSIFNKRFLLLALFVTFLLLFVGYFGDNSWRSYLRTDVSEDARDIDPSDPEEIAFKNNIGNFFRIVNESMYTFKVLLPILLTFPYLYTYIEEKTNKYRYYMIPRKGHQRYLQDKIIAVAISSTLSILLGQFLAFAIIFCFTAHVHNPDTLSNIILLKQYESFFFNYPYLFFFLQMLVQVIYMICFQIFALGIASFLKNHIYIYVLPFIIHTILSMLAPNGYRLTSIFDITHFDFSPFSFTVMMCLMVVTGIILIKHNENRWKQQG